jgi:hypothetical protein
MDAAFPDAQALVDRVTAFKGQTPIDLSSDQDLTVALMNLISIEEHLFFTGAKTGKEHYYEILKEVREVRKELLKKIVVDYEGEVWCISKHLLAASMRLMEVGTKQIAAGRSAEAKDLFDKAYGLYTLFWGINLKDATSPGFRARLRALVSKVINCCIE